MSTSIAVHNVASIRIKRVESNGSRWVDVDLIDEYGEALLDVTAFLSNEIERMDITEGDNADG